MCSSDLTTVREKQREALGVDEAARDFMASVLSSENAGTGNGCCLEDDVLRSDHQGVEARDGDADASGPTRAAEIDPVREGHTVGAAAHERDRMPGFVEERTDRRADRASTEDDEPLPCVRKVRRHA